LIPGLFITKHQTKERKRVQEEMAVQVRSGGGAGRRAGRGPDRLWLERQLERCNR
jgi:hypothetical protein